MNFRLPCTIQLTLTKRVLAVKGKIVAVLGVARLTALLRRQPGDQHYDLRPGSNGHPNLLACPWRIACLSQSLFEK